MLQSALTSIPKCCTRSSCVQRRLWTVARPSLVSTRSRAVEATARIISASPKYPTVAELGRQQFYRSFMVQSTQYKRVKTQLEIPIVNSELPPPRSIVILATQHYASLFSDESKFLEDFAKSITGIGFDTSLQIVGGIVDGLPGDHLEPERSKGFSYFYTDEVLDIEPVSTKSTNEQDTSFIQFEVGQAARKSLIVKVALANTLFSNSRHSTLCYRGQAEENIGRDPKSLIVRVPDIDTPEMPCQFVLDPSLHPLTQPRRINAGNGNILSRLEKSSLSSSLAEAKVFPASIELEKAVSTWLDTDEARGQAAVEVFARITSSEPKGGVELPVDSYRLRRVLSGGGGWGKKAGLLALDPQEDIEGFDIPNVSDSLEPNAQESDTDSTEVDGSPFFSRRTNLIRIGDWVQFFIPRTPKASNVQLTNNLWSFSKVRPSDVYVSDEWSIEEVKVSDEGVVWNKFGCASEGGFWVNNARFDVPGAEIRIARGQSHISNTDSRRKQC